MIASLLVLVLCFWGVFCEPGAVAWGAQAKTIKVSNARQFLEALGSDRIIEMSYRGDYNLSAWDPYLVNKKDMPKLARGVSWSEASDGGELVLRGIKNLKIDGSGPKAAAAKIVIDPRYSFVLRFENCDGIAMEGVTAGHSKGGDCEGGVFSFTGSSRITLANVSMYGCGTEGLALARVSEMQVTHSRIYDCNDAIMTADGGNDIAFASCVFEKNHGYTLVGVSGTRNMSFSNCAFEDNQGRRMFEVEDATISVSDSTFARNKADPSIQDSVNVKFTNCKFDGGAPAAMRDSDFLDLCAADSSLEQIVEAIKAGANVNARDENGATPLLLAVITNSSLAVITELLKNGADVNAADDLYGLTALMAAAWSHTDPGVVSVLIDSGADVNIKNNDGNTAIDFASKNEKLKNTEALRKLEAASMSDSGFLDLCAAGSLEQIVEAIKAGANLNAKGQQDTTALMFAAYSNSNPDVITVLVKNGADVNAKNLDGWTALMFAVQNNPNPEIITALVKNGADVNARDQSDTIPLFLAMLTNSSLAVIAELLKNGADVNARDDLYGMTALMAAAWRHTNPNVISLLIDSGADVNMKDNDGNTAIDFAGQNEKLKNTEALKKLEAASR